MPVKVYPQVNRRLFQRLQAAWIGTRPAVLRDAQGGMLLGQLPDRPVVIQGIANRNYTVGDSTISIDLRPRFRGATSYETSPLPAGVTLNGAALVIDPAAVLDAALISIRGRNAGGLSEEAIEFTLTVRIPAPRLVAPFPAVSLRVGADPVVIDMREHFAGELAEILIDPPVGSLAGLALTLDPIEALEARTVTITARNSTGEDQGTMRVEYADAFTAPQVVRRPVIAGDTAEGGRVEATDIGTASGNPAPAPELQWLSDDEIVGGETGQAIEDTTGLGGTQLRLRVTWASDYGDPAVALSDPLSIEEAEPAAFLRAASDPADLKVHSGHSLVDSYVNGGEAFPGFLASLFIEQFGESAWVFEGTDYKDTLPGSPMHIRWNDASDPRGAVLGIERYQSLVVTEGGPPFRIRNNTAPWIDETLRYAMNFAVNAYRNGNGGQGASVALWSIWPNTEGWQDRDDNMGEDWRDLGGFRPVVEEYGRTFRYIADYVTWKMHQLHPELPDDWRMWLFPGHAWMARIYDDIAAGDVPGITDHRQLFRDDIHPNDTGEYGLSVFMHALQYQTDPRALAYRPSFVSAELAAYFKRLAWEVATTEEAAGMGGRANADPVWIPAFGDQVPDYAFSGDTLPDPTPEPEPDPEPGTDFTPSDLPGLLYAMSAPLVMDGATVTEQPLPSPGAAGSALYIVLNVNLSEDQVRAAGGVIAQLVGDGGETLLSMNYSAANGNVLIENGYSGGNHGYTLTPLELIATGDAITLQGWIDPARTPTGHIDGPQNNLDSDLTMPPIAATRIRFGTPDWGGEVATGTVNRLAVFDRVPGAADRTALRAWVETPEPAPEIRAFAFPAPGARFDMDFANQQYHGGTQPRDTSGDDGRFFHQMQWQPSPVLYEEADGSLHSVSTGGALRISTRGLIVHRTVGHSHILYNRELSRSPWVAAGCTAARNLAARDGTNGASRITVAEDGATIMQPYAGGTGNRTVWMDVKRVFGSGSISVTTDDGLSWEELDLSAPRFDGWSRCGLPMRTIEAGAGIAFRFSNAGDVFGIDFVQLSDVDYETSPIFVAGSAVRKVYDRPSVGLDGSGIGGTKSGLAEFYGAAQNWGMYAEFTTRFTGNVFGQLIAVWGSGIAFKTSYTNGDPIIRADPEATRFYPEMNKVIGICDPDGSGRLCVNGGPVIRHPGPFGPYTSLNHTDIMANGAGSANPEGIFRRLTFFDASMSDEEMQAWTA